MTIEYVNKANANAVQLIGYELTQTVLAAGYTTIMEEVNSEGMDGSFCVKNGSLVDINVIVEVSYNNTDWLPLTTGTAVVAGTTEVITHDGKFRYVRLVAEAASAATPVDAYMYLSTSAL